MLTQLINITSINQLPKEIPLILVRGAVLMPKAQLPLPIFDHIPLPLMNAGGKDPKFIGLIQPNAALRETPDFDDLTLFSIGTLARIIEVNEISDNKMIVTLEGICRFKLLDKQDTEDGYPVATVCYNQFSGDLIEENDFTLDRVELIKKLKHYFGRLDIKINLEEINKVSNQKLITALAMACPFRPSEKQVLLETQNMKDQSLLITRLIEMTSYTDQDDLITYH